MAKNKSNIKYEIRNGKLYTVGKGPKKTVYSNKRPKNNYAKYVKKAKELGIEPFLKEEFQHAYKTQIINQGRNMTPEHIAERQSWGGITEGQKNARYNAAKKLFPNKYISEEDFIKNGGLKEIDDLIQKITEENPNLSSTDLSKLVGVIIFGSN